MNRLFFTGAFLLGATAVIWMASTFVGTNALALAVTLVIGCVYAIGFMELVQFRRGTFTLGHALAAIPENIEADNSRLDLWLRTLHPSLRNAVRMRIEGERVGLPAPVITPYLVGLLVMLGLLGTFVGMVDTLSGAVIALEATTELQAIRAGLAAPINGLSVAFGTSVAGVAASAMLGLISTLSRRDRMLETRVLDDKIATIFRTFSLGYNRQETYKALQVQAQALPAVAQKLNAIADQLGHMGDTLSEKLIASQEQFHQTTKAIYNELAASVETSLKESLAESGRLAGESIKPVVAQAMAGIAGEAQATHQAMTNTAQEQLQSLSVSFNSSSEALISSWAKRQEESDKAKLSLWVDSLGLAQAQASTQLVDTSKLFTEELKKSTELQQASLHCATQNFESISDAVTGQWLTAGKQMETLTSTLKNGISELREEESRRSEEAVERLGSLEATVALHLATLGKELEEPMARLIQTASETPRAAAEVIGRLRDEISNNIERDNSLLEERQRIMEQLTTLSSSLEQTSLGQREALELMVNSSADLLEKIGSQFSEKVGSEVSQMSGIAQHFAGSATEMASLGESFTLAVDLFSESNGQLIDKLSLIEASLDKSSTRSDEQMGYYVAQARQIIDQSMLSQREMFEELRQLGQKDLLAPVEEA
ncbi:MAG: hypothetical protein IMF06_13970 [Proteobacteria bacterium]|nr:hypothetical protein [Pseudomonadota bacterium]